MFLLTAVSHEGDIQSIAADAQYVKTGRPGGTGLFPANSPQSANIVIYCDDDHRWVKAALPQRPDTADWWDPINDMILKTTRHSTSQSPGCWESSLGISAETYRNVVHRDRSRPPPQKSTITICSRAYARKQDMGFFSIKLDNGRSWWRPGVKQRTIDQYYFLSAIVVHEVMSTPSTDNPSRPERESRAPIG